MSSYHMQCKRNQENYWLHPLMRVHSSSLISANQAAAHAKRFA